MERLRAGAAGLQDVARVAAALSAPALLGEVLRCCQADAPDTCCTSSSTAMPLDCVGFASPLDEELVGEAAPPRPCSAFGPARTEDAAGREEDSGGNIQRLLREFAGDVALDEGIPVEACFDGQAPRRSLLRMDRRLSQLELWPAEGLHGEPPAGAWVVVPLRQTGPVAKGDADQ
ncbi:unnamed protein product, partial [Prorocentrum cordatum]